MDVAVLHHTPRCISISATDTFSERASQCVCLCVCVVYPTHRCISTHWPHSFAHSHRHRRRREKNWLLCVYAITRALSSLVTVVVLSSSKSTISSKHKFQLSLYILFSSLPRWFFFAFRDILSLPNTTHDNKTVIYFPFSLLSAPSISTFLFLASTMDIEVHRFSLCICVYVVFWCVIMQMEFHSCWLIYGS